MMILEPARTRSLNNIRKTSNDKEFSRVKCLYTQCLDDNYS